MVCGLEVCGCILLFWVCFEWQFYYKNDSISSSSFSHLTGGVVLPSPRIEVGGDKKGDGIVGRRMTHEVSRETWF